MVDIAVVWCYAGEGGGGGGCHSCKLGVTADQCVMAVVADVCYSGRSGYSSRRSRRRWKLINKRYF